MTTLTLAQKRLLAVLWNEVKNDEDPRRFWVSLDDDDERPAKSLVEKGMIDRDCFEVRLTEAGVKKAQQLPPLLTRAR